LTRREALIAQPLPGFSIGGGTVTIPGMSMLFERLPFRWICGTWWNEGDAGLGEGCDAECCWLPLGLVPVCSLFGFCWGRRGLSTGYSHGCG